MQIFSFADNYRCQYDDSIPDAETFYPSSGYSDELLWAAAWLYRATNNDYYLQYSVTNAVEFGGTGNAVKIFSWDNKYAGLQILLSKVLLDGDGQSYTSTLRQYKAKADFFACAYLQKNNGFNVPMTPGGLAYLLPSNNMQYAASASFLLAVYSDYLAPTNSVVECPDGQVQPQDLLNYAKSQADYFLGKNPQSMSYLVGYGTKYPEKVHHRGSSIPSKTVLCESVGCVQGFEAWYKSPNTNPNVIHGALVGGPDSSDCFSDDRDNYEQNEPTTSATSPLIGLFSRMLSASTTTSGYKPPTSYEPPLSTPKPQETYASSTPLGPPQRSQPQHELSPAPAPSSDYRDQESPAASPEIVDYVLTQPSTSEAVHKHNFKYSYLVFSGLFLVPIFAIM